MDKSNSEKWPHYVPAKTILLLRYPMFLFRDTRNVPASNEIRDRYKSALMELPDYKSGDKRISDEDFIPSVFALKHELHEKMGRR